MAGIRKPKLLQWTHHSREKMRFYRLTEGRIKRVINAPSRMEEGVAPDTVAFMQPASQTKFGKAADWNQEIWVMVQDKGDKRTVISVWRYPGKTKPGQPLPPEIIQEMRAAL